MIPECNGISRLDEMMSGVARVDMIIEWFIYSYSYNSYVLQIVDVARLSFCVELTGLFTWLGFIVSWRPG